MIDVAFTPAGLRPADAAVVIDVLRATSTATQALAAGYRGVACADSIDRALGLPAPGLVLAGERHCLVPPGFEPRVTGAAEGIAVVVDRAAGLDAGANLARVTAQRTRPGAPRRRAQPEPQATA